MEGDFKIMLKKSPPCLRPARRDFAQAGRPSLPKRGKKTSLWQREVGRDFINTVVILKLLISCSNGHYFTPQAKTGT